MRVAILIGLFFSASVMACIGGDPGGYDHGLHKHRLASNVGHDPATGCESPRYVDIVDDGNSHWTFGVQNEQIGGEGFPGCDALSYFPSDDVTESPIQVRWEGNATDGYVIDLKTNQNKYHEPGFDPEANGGNMWTWVTVQDQHDWLIPHIKNLQMSFDIWSNSWTPGNSAVRHFAGIRIKDKETGAKYILSLHVYSDEWERGSPLITSKVMNNNKHVFTLDGAFWGLQVGAKQWQPMQINWTMIVGWLIYNGYMPDIINKPRDEIGITVRVAHETRSSSASGDGAPVSRIKFREWKIGEID